MSKPLKLALAAFFLIGGTAVSNSAHADNHENEQAVAAAMQTLDDFMLAFNARDMDAWSATLNYPHVRFASGTVTTFPTRDAFTAREPFEALARTGWDHSHWLSPSWRWPDDLILTF